MNKKNDYKKRLDKGDSLIEVIIAIGICGFGLACVLGLYGIGLKINIGSENILNQSLEVNSISDELNNMCKNEEKNSKEALEVKTRKVLINYPSYTLSKIEKEEPLNLYTIEIEQIDTQGNKKRFIIKLFWGSE